MTTQNALRNAIFYLLFLVGNTSYSTAAVDTDSIQKIIDSKTGEQKVLYLIHLSDVNRASAQNDMALQYSNQALQFCKTNPALKNIPAVYNSLGLIYQGKLEFDNALNNFLKSGDCYDQINDESGKAYVNHNIGEVYRQMRNYKKAVEYFNLDLKFRYKENNKKRIADAELGMGAVYYDMNDFENSILYFNSALVYYRSSNDLTTAALALNNIGSIYNEMEKYPQAISNYKSAMEIFSQLKDSANYSMCLSNIGNVYNIMGDYKQGIDYSLKGLAISNRLDDKQNIAASYVFLEEGYRLSGDWKKALEYQTKLLNLKDTIYDLQTNQNIAEMQTRYDTEKKEKQNQILQQQNDLQNLSINRQKIISYSISFGLILVLILAFYIYRGFRQKQKANHLLEKKQIEIVSKNNELKTANTIIHEKNKDITDSIKYAKRLQSAILKPENNLKDYFSDGFVLFKPKDIVSGDFYWFERSGNLNLIAAADCTGHGVPGAFMSIIGCNLLSQAVNEYAITQPAAILNSVNKGLSKVLQQRTDKTAVTDGMDIALCSFDSEKMILEYSGAYNSLWIVRGGELLEYAADKFPVGAFVDKEVRVFKNHSIPVQKGDMVYLFSDGFADQFGGPLGKKFKYKQFQKLFIDNYTKSTTEQKSILESAFESWIGQLEQVDDVLVIGIRI